MQNRKFKTVIAQSSLSSLAKHNATTSQDPLQYPISSGPKSTAHLSQGNDFSLEKLFDNIMERIQDEPTSLVLESTLKPLFDATQCIVWQYLNNIKSLFSQSFSVTVPASPSLLLTALQSKVPLCCSNQSSHSNFQLAVDTKVLPPNAPVLFIPIISRDLRPVACIQFTRKTELPFSVQEIAFSSRLAQKLAVYSSFLFPDLHSLRNSYQLVQIESLQNTIRNVCGSIMKLMRCRKAEIWLYKRKKDIFIRFDPSSNTAVEVNSSKLGVAGNVLTKGNIISSRNITDHESYSPIADGFFAEAFLGIPFAEKSTKIWAVVCRGRSSPPYFTPNDISRLSAFTPFAIQSLSSVFTPRKIDTKTQKFQERLSALLEVAEALSGVLVIDQLIPLIMQHSVQLLNCERCSLFLVDIVKKELQSYFHGGLKQAIRIPIGKGIAGTTATTGEVINIADAYSDPRFDNSVDKKTGYKTKTILSTPIRNNRGEIIGVVEMINKKGGVFDDEDLRLLIGFNVFCGISLDNAKLYEASLNLARQVRSFVDMSTALNQTAALKSVLTEILEKCVSVVNGTGAALYRIEKGGKLIEICHLGTQTKYAVFAEEAAQKRKIHIYTAEEAAKILQKLNLSEGINDFGDTISEQFCCLPLFNSEGEVSGVLLVRSLQRIASEDVSLLDCFAIFAAVSLERSELRDVAKLGTVELELKEWVADNERDSVTEIPQKLQLPIEDESVLWTVKFDAPKWAGMPFFKEVFAIFKRYELQKEFGITNEKLFRFLCEIRDTYNNVPYHNWRHACDVTQFMTYELVLSGAEKQLTKLELFAMVVAALCHDANHDGFTNVFNVKAETPLGILFKNQSVMETHHCEIAIGIITKEETNLFANLKPAEFKFMWTTVIQLILATDMAKHFTFLKDFNELFDNGKWDPNNNQEHKLMMMQLILKTADISNVSRPFELADRWCDVLCEEFFRQGDLEMASGMEYTSDLNDREHLDKPKSQIGFYTFVCLPLYQAVAKALPPLEANVSQVESNLSVWKAAAGQK